MQDAEKMKEAGAKVRIDCSTSKALYDSMLKIPERFLQDKLEGKPTKILNPEREKRLDMMRKLLVQNTGIDNLEFQEIVCKDLKFLKENEVHNRIYSNIKQKTASEAISVLHLPAEESCKQSNEKNEVSTSTKVVAARLVLLDEIKNKKAADEDTLAEKMKGRSDPLGVKMGSCSSSNVALEGSTKIQLKLNQEDSQPQQDHDILSSQGIQVNLRELKPEWLEKFFRRTFFEPCSEHPIRRNELNKYCIDCDASLCQYCVSLASHAGHKLLKIYRHVYKDVVPLDEIGRHVDCSKIQPYRCNRQMVIALTPLPHSGTKTNEEATCHTCKRKLIEYEVYNYCSISCKVEAFMKKENELAPPFLLLDQVVEGLEAIVQQVQIAIPDKTRKRRKGIPHRSPLF
ncbi:uncharacterized protein [Spinacia oleracea]|uniref:Uncharacterized protein isoform X4 n=1 Tax=Spinacia oleracea TaxID=3562 RepID=A0A9R0IDA3_SPIOL|nr:uncharacterized protein LOC110786780 isoform X4 [Spinacia oleracea]